MSNAAALPTTTVSARPAGLERGGGCGAPGQGPAARQRGRARRTERGLSESVQWTVLTPLLLLAVLGIIQAGILLHGRTVAANAALAGAEAQSLAGSGQGAGERVALEVAQRGGLVGVTVSVSGGQQVRVQVQGRVQTFFDIGLSRVSSVAELPAEEPR